MIAALGMYDRPETSAANDALWSAIRSELGQGPEHLDRNADPWDIWQNPDMLLSQTCGMPYRTRLYGSVQLVGTPDYGIRGCQPGYYNTVFVTRKGESNRIEDYQERIFAYNDPVSQSGWAAAQNHAHSLGFTFQNLMKSGAHRQSAQSVADARADIAALDAVTWRLMLQYDGFVGDLQVIESTPPTPGLPLITAQKFDPVRLRNAIAEAIQALSPDHMRVLGIKSIIAIPAQAYLDVPIPAGPM